MPNERDLSGELEALREYWALRADPVFRGEGVPRGDGRAVLVLPGLFGNDFYTQPLRAWLTTIGYRPVVSTLAINAGCPRRLLERVEAGFARQGRGDGGPVAIVGHSRGGMLGKALATRLGARCSHLVAIGSPVGRVLQAGKDGLVALAAGAGGVSEVAAPQVVEAGRRAMKLFDPDCEVPFCECDYVRDLLGPLAPETRTFAVYSSEDQVVSPEACRIPGAVNAEITGTHSGLTFNRLAYPHIAAALAA